MFARRYFPSRYFARRYWPAIGGVPPSEVTMTTSVSRAATATGTISRLHSAFSALPFAYSPTSEAGALTMMTTTLREI